MIKDLIKLLHEGDYSCVIENGEVRTFTRRGVADLYVLLKNEPEFLTGALVADKVVGKGAAALMALGGVKEVYADVISEPGRALLKDAGISVIYMQEVPYISNRDNSGWCPVERLCAEENSPEAILPLIETFINSRI